MPTKSKPDSFNGVNKYWSYNEKDVLVDSREIPWYVDTTDTRTGASVKNYKKIIESGGDATSDMDAYEFTITSEPCVWSFRTTSGNYKNFHGNGVFSRYAAGFPFDSSLLTLATNGARAKAYSQLRAGFTGLSFIGELRETIAMIRSPASALRTGLDRYITSSNRYRNAYKSKPHGSREFRKAVADSWLEYSFGWKPLLMDIQDAYKAYLEIANEKKYIPFKGTYRASSKVPRYYIGRNPAGHANIDMYASVVNNVSVAYSGSAYVKPGISTPNVSLGTTLPDFIPAAWELAPWSFLIDYFTNVGDVLDSWASAQLFSFSYVSSTSRLETIVTQENIATHNEIPSQSSGGVFRGVAKGYGKKVTRRSDMSLPIPELQTRVQLSSSRGLNIAALFQGKLFDARFKR